MNVRFPSSPSVSSAPVAPATKPLDFDALVGGVVADFMSSGDAMPGPLAWSELPQLISENRPGVPPVYRSHDGNLLFGVRGREFPGTAEEFLIDPNKNEYYVMRLAAFVGYAYGGGPRPLPEGVRFTGSFTEAQVNALAMAAYAARG
jgi:hypothetical protein